MRSQNGRSSRGLSLTRVDPPVEEIDEEVHKNEHGSGEQHRPRTIG